MILDQKIATPVTLRIPALKGDAQLYVHGEQDMHVSRRIRDEGIWEPYETSLLLEFLHAGDVFVDVGANIGYFSVVAALHLQGSGQVVAFEPDPLNFKLLRGSAQLNNVASGIIAVQAALAATEQEAKLYLSDDNLGDHQIFVSGKARQSTPISLVNGSDYLLEQLQPAVQHIDLLKVDTQGSEYDVICGLMPLLQQQLQDRSSPPRIIIELTPFSLREAGASGRQLIELLATLDLPLWIIDHIEHRLVRSDAEALAQWCDNVDAVTGDQGFMNILVGQGLA